MENATLITEQLYFRVDGEWITEFARDWFWKEDRPYPQCEELLLSCLGTDQISLDEKKKIVQDILEGRKKLVGENTFTLEDDNKNVRPLSVKFEELRRELKIQELHDRMTVRMIDFVDPYSIVKSLRVAKEYNVSTLDQCRTWFWYSDAAIDTTYMRPRYPGEDMLPSYEKDTVGGLWLYDYPDIVYDAINKSDAYPTDKITKYRFWQAVYEIISEKSGFNTKDFKLRNEYYLASVRVRKEKEERLRKLFNPSLHDASSNETEDDDEICSNVSYSEKKTELDELSKATLTFVEKFLEEHPTPPTDDDDIRYISKYRTMRLIQSHFTEGDRYTRTEREYCIIPDSYEEWEGLIAPNGDFYSCDFGGHNCKAYYIMRAYPEKFPNLDYNEFGMLKHGPIQAHNALDYLLEQGWCATRYLPTIGCYINAPKNGHFTKAQENAIFDAKIKHDVSVDLGILGY